MPAASMQQQQQQQLSQTSHSSVSSSTSALLATSKNRSPSQLASPLSTSALHSQQLQSQARQEEVQQQQIISQHQPSMVVLPAAIQAAPSATAQTNTYSPSSNPVSAQIGPLPPRCVTCLRKIFSTFEKLPDFSTAGNAQNPVRGLLTTRSSGLWPRFRSITGIKISTLATKKPAI